MAKNYYLLLISVLLLGSIFLFSCEKESFKTDGHVELGFSLDTLTFDTVFTEIGSVTKSFKIYNNYEQSIRISEIKLAKQNAFFHINIDGVSTEKLNDLEILPNDSIYIFVEVVIDPNLPLDISPFIVEEEIVFVTNGNEQKVKLNAWGQNANYYPVKNGNGVDYRLVCEMNGTIVWDDPKPYVIYGRLFLDSCELIIPAGRQIYVHGGLGFARNGNDKLFAYNDGAFVVYNKGKITINGTADEPVVIQGDRLDEEYDDVYGQWVGFYFVNQAKQSSINHAIIKNAIRGIYVDSASELSVKSCIIHNTLGAGIEGRHAKINIENTLIYNNLASAIQLTYGGRYNINHCTLISDDNNSPALLAYNYTCTDFGNCYDPRFFGLNLNMNNNIIVGDQDIELSIADGTAGDIPQLMKYNVNNNIFPKSQMLELMKEEDFGDHFHDCLAIDEEPLFLDKDNFDFHLDTFSLAEKKAIPLNQLPVDLDGQQRDSSTPDIGCYEFLN